MKELLKKAKEAAAKAVGDAKAYVDDNKEGWKDLAAQQAKYASAKAKAFVVEREPAAREALRTGASVAKEFAIAGYRGGSDATQNLVLAARYSKGDLKRAQDRVEAQGGFYRELFGQRRAIDTLAIAGESLVMLLAAADVPKDVAAAYEAAYPE